MMSTKKKLVYSGIFFLVFLTILFRYPTVEHEVGSDTTYVHSMADNLYQNGYAKWIIHPASYFGLYALSYPSALQFIFAIEAQLTAISIELNVLLIGIAYSIFGVLAAFLLGKEIKNSSLFAFLTAFLFTSVPFYIHGTSWVASTKDFAVALLPGFVFLLLKNLKTGDVRYLILAFFILLIITSTHRVGYLAIVILAAYLFVLPVHSISKLLRGFFLKHEKITRVSILVVVAAIFLSVFLLQFYGGGILGGDITETYEKSYFFSGREWYTVVLNIGVNFTGKLGIFTIFLFMGIFLLSWQHRREPPEKFLIIGTIFITPFLPFRSYISDFSAPILIPLVVVGLAHVLYRMKKRKKLLITVFTVVILLAVSFSWVMKDHWKRTQAADTPIPEDVYTFSVYSRNYLTGSHTVNDGMTAGRISAISGKAALPLGGASKHTQSSQQLIYDFIDVNSMETKLMDFSTISAETDVIVETKNVPNSFEDWAYTIMLADNLNDDALKEKLKAYRIDYAVAAKHLVIKNRFYYLEYFVRETPFLESVNRERYKIYENSDLYVWYVQ